MTDAPHDEETGPGRRTIAAVAALALAALVAMPGLASADAPGTPGVASSDDPLTCVAIEIGGYQQEVCVHPSSDPYNCGYLSAEGDLVPSWRRPCLKLVCKIYNCHAE